MGRRMHLRETQLCSCTHYTCYNTYFHISVIFYTHTCYFCRLFYIYTRSHTCLHMYLYCPGTLTHLIRRYTVESQKVGVGEFSRWTGGSGYVKNIPPNLFHSFDPAVQKILFWRGLASIY